MVIGKQEDNSTLSMNAKSNKNEYINAYAQVLYY